MNKKLVIALCICSFSSFIFSSFLMAHFIVGTIHEQRNLKEMTPENLTFINEVINAGLEHIHIDATAETTVQ